jgi:hypothetical protein
VSSFFASRACVGRGSVGCGWSRAGRIALREPKTSCRRATPSGSSRQYFDGNVHNAVEPCGANQPCVRQNRVVLAVVATVKLLRRTAGASRHPAFPAPSWLEGGATKQSSGETCRENAKA